MRNGAMVPGWIAVMLASAAAVLVVDPARHHRRQVDVGIVGPYPAGSGAAFDILANSSDAHGARIQDPLGGSLSAAVSQWLVRTRPCGRSLRNGSGAVTGR